MKKSRGRIALTETAKKMIREEKMLFEEFGETEDDVTFDFGNFKIRTALLHPPRRGVSSGTKASTKLYYFQVKVLSTIKLKKASEANLKKFLQDREVTFSYGNKQVHGQVIEVKVSEIIDSWYLGLKIAVTNTNDLEIEESSSKEQDDQYQYFLAKKAGSHITEARSLKNPESIVGNDFFVVDNSKLNMLSTDEWYNVQAVQDKKVIAKQVGTSRTVTLPFKNFVSSHKKKHVLFVEDM